MRGGRGAEIIMGKPKRKLTAEEKARKERNRREYMTVFIHGKQKRVKRPTEIDGMDIDDFILKNADPIWLHQNEMWEYLVDDELYPLDEEASPPCKEAYHVSDEKEIIAEKGPSA